MDYRLITAEMQDVGAVNSLYQEAIAAMIENHIYQWDERYPDLEVLTEDISKGEMYLLKKDGNIISCIVINEEQDEEYQTGDWYYREGRIAVIHRLCVHPKEQGRGIGRLTVELAEALAKEKGFTHIRLDAFSMNPYALRLYEKLGYRYAGEVHFRKGKFYLMEKSLI